MIARLSHFATLVVSALPGLLLAAPPEGKPVLVPLWKTSTIGLVKNEDFGWEKRLKSVERIKTLYEAVQAECKTRKHPLIPPVVPVGRGSSVVYVNDLGVVSRCLIRVVEFGNQLEPGELRWLSEYDNGLSEFVQNLDLRMRLGLSDSAGLGSKFELQVLNRTLCHEVLATNESLWGIDDAALLPASDLGNTGSRDTRVPSWWLKESYLKEYSLKTGKLTNVVGNWIVRATEGANLFILSAPISLAGNHVFLREKDRNLILTTFNLAKYNAVAHQHGVDRGLQAGRKWETEIVKAPKGVLEEPHRRIHALRLLETDGLILVPTNLGRVVAVDAQSGKTRWTHEYAPIDAKRFPTFAPEWTVVSPAVVDDRYIIAPADFPELLCLKIADGKKIWSAKKGDGLYPAVVGDRVLVIGEKTVRSLSVKDGNEQWKTDLPGLPCGRGAVLGDCYLLPFSEPKTWLGAIAMIDVNTGKIKEILKPAKEEPIGNLVVHGEFLLSQTLTDLAVYPIKK